MKTIDIPESPDDGLAARIVECIVEITHELLRCVLGGHAPTRRRPRRVQRKLDQRRGRMHYPISIFRRRHHEEKP